MTPEQDNGNRLLPSPPQGGSSSHPPSSRWRFWIPARVYSEERVVTGMWRKSPWRKGVQGAQRITVYGCDDQQRWWSLALTQGHPVTAERGRWEQSSCSAPSEQSWLQCKQPVNHSGEQCKTIYRPTVHGPPAVSKQRKSFDSFAFLATATHFRQTAKYSLPFDVLRFNCCYKSIVVNMNWPFDSLKTFSVKSKSNLHNVIPIKICTI